MRRFVIAFLAGLAVLLGGLAAGGPPAFAAGQNSGAVSTSVDDFHFQSFDADYYLGRNDRGNSTLRTVETIVAVFPDIDQNRGIRRAIPNSYDGHPVDLQIVSVTDESGAALSRDIVDDDDGDFTLVTIASDDYVHGAKTYVIEYLQTNVTLEPENAIAATANEFYWDVNGTGWAQPFDTVTARVHLDRELAAAFSESAACYQGFTGSNEPCLELTRAESGDELVVTARADGLGPRQNLTIALGFAEGTFVARDNSYLASPASFGQIAALALLLASAVFALVKRRTTWRDAPGRGTIIPEYLPPKQVTPLLASTVYGKGGKATAAEFLHLAVNRNVRVIEEAPASGRGKPSFHFEYVTDAGLSEHGVALVTALFGTRRSPGDRTNMSRPNPKLSTAMQSLVSKTKKLGLTLGYRRKPAGRAPMWIFLIGGAVGVLSVLFGFAAIDDDRGVLVAIVLILLAGALFVWLVVLVADVRPLTGLGAELRDYLRGLETYITLAEADRMRVLQSPDGAVRTPFRPIGETGWSTPRPAEAGEMASTGQIVKLYERLLPYAVLFGLEKEWSAQLGAVYDQTGTQPSWYEGSGAFNTAVFVAGVGGLSSTASSSWSGSSSSSSSGGSSGGGSSGGGGGGGGGGGV